MVNTTMNLLELFAGDRSIGKAAEKQGLKVFSVDWQDFDNIDLSMDIGEMQPEDVPFVPDAVWASPDCASYSVAAVKKHRRNSIEPISEYAVKCDAVNQHFISLIKHWQGINPDMVFFIENPRGMMRKMPWMQDFTRHTVWYCKYGDVRAKPTDVWTNSKTWIPRPVCKNGNRDCHHQPAPRGSRTGTQGLKGTFNRSMIPEELCNEIVDSLFMEEPVLDLEPVIMPPEPEQPKQLKLEL